jgi:hypothetical protein
MFRMVTTMGTRGRGLRQERRASPKPRTCGEALSVAATGTPQDMGEPGRARHAFPALAVREARRPSRYVLGYADAASGAMPALTTKRSTRHVPRAETTTATTRQPRSVR